MNYKAQSLFLYQFAKYVSWPQQAVADEIVIGVLGNSPILEELQLMAALKRGPEGQRLVIRELQALDDMKGIHILYLSAAKSRMLKAVRTALGRAPTLLVAERGGLARKGAAINFIVLDNDTLRFEVNPDTLAAHNLRMSRELLSLGFEVP
ncbi:MAG: YfiR family protein [Bacteroidetes bacterium]|nr:MAG: YfiR family protein [Bacteroidota bacterium]